MMTATALAEAKNNNKIVINNQQKPRTRDCIHKTILRKFLARQTFNGSCFLKFYATHVMTEKTVRYFVTYTIKSNALMHKTIKNMRKNVYFAKKLIKRLCEYDPRAHHPDGR